VSGEVRKENIQDIVIDSDVVHPPIVFTSTAVFSNPRSPIFVSRDLSRKAPDLREATLEFTGLLRSGSTR
jgi:hypothetical protein